MIRNLTIRQIHILQVLDAGNATTAEIHASLKEMGHDLRATSTTPSLVHLSETDLVIMTRKGRRGRGGSAEWSLSEMGKQVLGEVSTTLT